MIQKEEWYEKLLQAGWRSKHFSDEVGCKRRIHRCTVAKMVGIYWNQTEKRNHIQDAAEKMSHWIKLKRKLVEEMIPERMKCRQQVIYQVVGVFISVRRAGVNSQAAK